MFIWFCCKDWLRQDLCVNGKEAPFTKSELVIKAYEDYLFANNKAAFEKYWAAQKKYGDAWFKRESNEIREELEKELSEVLQNSGIDIKAITRSMGNDILEVNGTKNSVLPLDYFYFMNLVYTGQPLDLKTRAYSEEYDFSLWSRQWNEDIPGDYLGNYLFGYFGQGFLMLDRPFLKFGAGAAQGWSDKDIGKWWDNFWKGNYGDNPDDAKYIQDGIRDYKNRK